MKGKNKHPKGSIDAKREKEIEASRRNIPDWLEDDGEVFKCKTCRKVRPVSIKSKERIGRCKLCAGE